MAKKDITYFKDKFKTGYKITESDWEDILDSFRHKDELMSLSDVEGINTYLSDYRHQSVLIDAGDLDQASVIALFAELLADYYAKTDAIPIASVTNLQQLLSEKLNTAAVENIVDQKLVGVGVPEISDEGYWIVNGEVTGVKAFGQDADMPNIKQDGYWYIGNETTGVRAVIIKHIDYNSAISGTRNPAPGSVLEASREFITGSLAVYLDGLRLSEGKVADYTVDDDDKSVLFNRPLSIESKIIFEYIIK